MASVPTLATTIELKPYAVGDPRGMSCPAKVMAYQTAQPYREGGYAWDGMVNLQAIATPLSLSQTDLFSATWVGTLKPPYQNCRAAAGMAVVDGKPYTGHSYLRMRFVNGKVYFMLDMTGMQDANNLTPAILQKTIVKNNPRWTWGGTD